MLISSAPTGAHRRPRDPADDASAAGAAGIPDRIGAGPFREMTAGQAQWVAAWRFSFLVLVSCATLKLHASTTNPATLVWVAWRRCCGETLPPWVSTLDLHWSVTHCVRVRLFSPSVVATGLWWADPVRVRRAVGTRGQGAPTLSSVRRSPLDSGSSDAGRRPLLPYSAPGLAPTRHWRQAWSWHHAPPTARSHSPAISSLQPGAPVRLCHKPLVRLTSDASRGWHKADEGSSWLAFPPLISASLRGWDGRDMWFPRRTWDGRAFHVKQARRIRAQTIQRRTRTSGRSIPPLTAGQSTRRQLRKQRLTRRTVPPYRSPPRSRNPGTALTQNRLPRLMI
ncbi:MAG: hypothetical protein JWN06_230 [Propionibacteriaceae bacterium]|nr:hypothetical protein [Propionibacteriaceae bacterium]